jgi:hypothetical protein
MKSIKLLTCILVVSAISMNANAQIFTKINPALHDALQKVINDIPNHMQNLLGAMVSESGHSTSYACNVNIPGAVNPTITSYNSVKDKSRTLQAMILETESFEEARKKYNELVNQLKAGKYVYPGDKTPFKWNVNYDKPDENKNFSGSIFRPGDAKAAFKNLKIEVALNYQMTSFVVNLFVYEKVEDNKIETVDLNKE